MVNFLFRGSFYMVAKWAAYLFVALLLCCYSEYLNGRNVDAALLGDWVFIPIGLTGALFVGSLVTMAADSLKKS